VRIRLEKVVVAVAALAALRKFHSLPSLTHLALNLIIHFNRPFIIQRFEHPLMSNRIIIPNFTLTNNLKYRGIKQVGERLLKGRVPTSELIKTARYDILTMLANTTIYSTTGLLQYHSRQLRACNEKK